MRGIPQPARHEVDQHPRLCIIRNNLASHLQAALRDRRSDTSTFQAMAHELSRLLLWEALAGIALSPAQGERFDGEALATQQIAERIAGVVILRAGLAFEPPFRALLPDCPLYQVGIKRNEATLQPDVYASNLPEYPDWVDRALIMDPMLATGGSTLVAVDHLRRHHAKRIDILCLVAAPYGVQRVLEADPDVHILTLALDDCLNDAGYILPGLGDAGDRYFGT